tara:strand:- start:1449 stop:1892 length:444 start_codon:yes stop_codon:yes gene_type:complete
MIKINCSIDSAFNEINTGVVRNIAKHVIKSQKIKDADLTFIFTSDELLSELKMEFFHKDHLTDVIAFRLNDYKDKLVDGEVYISLPRAKENSLEFDQPYEKELSRLIIHGCLHVLGYDDQTSNEKKLMTSLEDEYLNKISWNKIIEI